MRLTKFIYDIMWRSDLIGNIVEYLDQNKMNGRAIMSIMIAVETRQNYGNFTSTFIGN